MPQFPVFQYQVFVEPLRPLTDSFESRWHEGWSEPSVKSKIGLLASQQQFLALHPRPIISIPWYEWLNEPVRIPARLPTPSQPYFSYYPNPVINITWYDWLSEPVRFKPTILTADQSFLFRETEPPIFDTTDWFNWWSEPVRFKPILLPADQPYLFEDTNFLPNPAKFLEGWYNWFSEPVRFKQGLSATLQQTLAYYPRLLPKPNVTATLLALEINTDAPIIAVNVVNFIPNIVVDARVSLAEVQSGSATSVVEQ